MIVFNTVFQALLATPTTNARNKSFNMADYESRPRGRGGYNNYNNRKRRYRGKKSRLEFDI